jgi:hypothetical protein
MDPNFSKFINMLLDSYVKEIMYAGHSAGIRKNAMLLVAVAAS